MGLWHPPLPPARTLAGSKPLVWCSFFIVHHPLGPPNKYPQDGPCSSAHKLPAFFPTLALEEHASQGREYLVHTSTALRTCWSEMTCHPLAGARARGGSCRGSADVHPKPHHAPPHCNIRGAHGVPGACNVEGGAGRQRAGHCQWARCGPPGPTIARSTTCTLHGGAHRIRPGRGMAPATYTWGRSHDPLHSTSARGAPAKALPPTRGCQSSAVDASGSPWLSGE